MNQQEPPRIEFPCADYAIKVIGLGGDDYEALVIEIVLKHAPDLDTTQVTTQPSRNGTFVSVRLAITATGPEQLKSLHLELMATGKVKMVI
ncbi:MAG: putative lipoic acid-binding regulatory protein [Motiliproteus sp.]|jgi:putative lipoic acid-binding regulatory protein